MSPPGQFRMSLDTFGRNDLIGHALITAILVAIAVDHTRDLHFWSRKRQALIDLLLGLTSALAIFASTNWGLHAGFYGNETRTMAEMLAEDTDIATHSVSPEHSHGPQESATLRGGGEPPAARPADSDASAVTADYQQSMMGMHDDMMAGLRHEDPVVAFVLGMIPHHQDAVYTARIQLRLGSDPENVELARHIIAEQQREIDAMGAWLQERRVEASDNGS